MLDSPDTLFVCRDRDGRVIAAMINSYRMRRAPSDLQGSSLDELRLAA